MVFLGVDPGASGAVAVIHEGSNPVMFPLSETPHDAAEFVRDQLNVYTEPGEVFAYLERVHAMPKQGVSSTFKFGTSSGFCIGLLTSLQVPYEEVSPKRWQQSLRCLSQGDKNVTKRKAQQLYPALRITHQTADAILLAELCLRERSGQSPRHSRIRSNRQ